MKRLFVLTLLGLFTCGVMFAQPKNSDKAVWKSAQKVAKQFEKEGWKVDGTRSLEEMLYTHNRNVNKENPEIRGSVVGNTSVTTLNQGQQWAATNASVFYAKQAGMALRGRVITDLNTGIKNKDASIDKFHESYEALVEKEIRGELKESFAIYREKKDGGIDYRIFYILNEEAASNARMRAMERAMKEAELAREDAEKISEFVRKGFQVKAGE